MRHLAHYDPPPTTYPYVNEDAKKCRICVILLGFRFWLITSKVAKTFFTIQIAQYEITLDSRCALFRYSPLFNFYCIFAFLYLRLCFPKNPFDINFVRSSQMLISLCLWKQVEFLWQCKGWYKMYTRPSRLWRLYWWEMSGKYNIVWSSHSGHFR